MVDEENIQIIGDERVRGVVGKSNFCIHYDSLVIAYRPLPSKISSFQFQNAFHDLVDIATSNFFFNVVIETIQEEITIIDALRRLDVVNKVFYEVHPTNPSNREPYKKIDEKLKKMEAQRLQQTVESKSGLNKNALLEDETYGALIMASDGYGKAVIEGKLNGNTSVITTGDSPIRVEIQGTDDPDKAMEELQPAIHQLLGRIHG